MKEVSSNELWAIVDRLQTQLVVPASFNYRCFKCEQRDTNDMILVETSPGELIDKITVLEIKEDRITDPEKLANVQYALGKLWAVRDAEIRESEELTGLTAELKATNERLWRAVEVVQRCAAAGDFGPYFTGMTMSSYRENNRRTALKKRIDEIFGFVMTEEKSYSVH